MNNYVYHNPGKIIFGKQTEQHIGEEIAKYASSCLIVLGGPFIKQNGLYDTVAASLQAAGVSYYDLDGIVPNPRLAQVYEGIELCRKHDIGFVLAIGGGSAIDTAKAVAAGVKAPDDIWSYFGTFTKFITDALPSGVLLTLPATGSESSNCAVITNDESGLKRSLFSDAVIPQFAILNPEMSYSLPAYQTASGSADILAHLMEAYFSPHAEHRSDRPPAGGRNGDSAALCAAGIGGSHKLRCSRGAISGREYHQQRRAHGRPDRRLGQPQHRA